MHYPIKAWGLYPTSACGQAAPFHHKQNCRNTLEAIIQDPEATLMASSLFLHCFNRTAAGAKCAEERARHHSKLLSAEKHNCSISEREARKRSSGDTLDKAAKQQRLHVVPWNEEACLERLKYSSSHYKLLQVCSSGSAFLLPQVYFDTVPKLKCCTRCTESLGLSGIC